MDRDWTFAVVTECQRFVCATVEMSLSDVLSAVEALGRALPSPGSSAEELFLRNTLYALATRWGYEQHRAMRTQCRFKECAPLTLAEAARFWPSDGRPVELFSSHVGAIRRELIDTHQPSLAQRAAVLIECSCNRAFDAASLAKALGAHPATVRRAFRRAWGMSPQEYLKRLRVTRAEEAIARDSAIKLEALALELGWTNKAGLYRAYRRIHEPKSRPAQPEVVSKH